MGTLETNTKRQLDENYLKKGAEMDKPVKKVVLDVSGHFPEDGKKKKVVTEKIWNKQNSRKAPVTALHSYCMRHQIDVPHIELINSEGEAHKPIFTMLCQVSLRGEIVS